MHTCSVTARLLYSIGRESFQGAETPPPQTQDILIGNGKLTGPHSVKYDLPGRVDVGGTVTARDIIIASGSVPFVPPGVIGVE